MARSNTIAGALLHALAALLLSGTLTCGGGSTSAPSPPPLQQFSGVTLSPPALRALRGHESASTLTPDVSGGFDSPITLTSSGVPQGVTVTFDPATIPPSSTSTMTVTVASGTPTGNYTISITGSGGGTQKTTQLTLTVTAQVLLNWNPSPSNDVVGYNVKRSTTSGSGYTRINTDLIPGTSYLDDTAQSGQTYYYVATAVDSRGRESTPSNEASAEVP
jgi:hypothetical protein